MAGKFMNLKKLIIPTMTLILMTSQLAGCALVTSREMVDMINHSETIEIELARPDYGEISFDIVEEDSIDWIQLDQLKTYNDGFRQAFDEIFNINIVTESGVNGKSGSLYVDEEGDRNGNTTLEDAFRNKVFVEKYWQNADVKSELAKIATKAYTDVKETDSNSLLASINAYYNLSTEGEDKEFKGTASLTREQFYAMIFKSDNGVRDIKTDDAYMKAIGTETVYSRFAQCVDDSSFLSVNTKSLDKSNIGGAISRAEAIHLIVQYEFRDVYAATSGREKAFSDTKNGGDIALKLGFKYEDDNGDIVGKDMWQSYTLAFMMQYPDKGMQEEIYRSMVVAKSIGLLGDNEEARWDEPLSKEEAIQLVINTQLAKNRVYGYLSDVEYGNINADKFKIQTDKRVAIGEDSETGLEYGEGWVEVPENTIPVDGNKVLSSGMTLGEVKSLIEFQRDLCKYEGMTEDEINNTLEQLAKDMGTTLSEVNRVVVSEVVTQPTQPTQQEQPSYEEEQPTYQEQPSSGGSGQQSTGGGSGVVQQPSTSGGDGTGGDGSFDGLRFDGVGSTVESPDVTFEMP